MLDGFLAKHRADLWPFFNETSCAVLTQQRPPRSPCAHARLKMDFFFSSRAQAC